VKFNLLNLILTAIHNVQSKPKKLRKKLLLLETVLLRMQRRQKKPMSNGCPELFQV